MSGHGLRQGARVRLLGLVVVGVLLATTGCVVRIERELNGVSYRADAFYAVVSQGPGDRRYIRSDTGGMTWSVVPRGDVPPAVTGGFRQLEHCAYDGICYRLNQERLVVERLRPDGGWAVEYKARRPVHEFDVNLFDSSQAVVRVSPTEIVYRSRSGVWSVLDPVAQTDPPRWQTNLLGLMQEPMTTVSLAIALALLGGLGARTDQFRTLWILSTIGVAGFMFAGPAGSVRGWDALWLRLSWVLYSIGVLVIHRAIAARRQREEYR